MEAHGISEIDLRQGDQRWNLKRGPTEVMQVVPATGFAATSAAPAASVAVPPELAPPAAEDPNTVLIKSPTVGTFYDAPSPGDPPFVAIGTKVSQDSVVCIIEAMKVFNQIAAEVNGIVTAVLVKSGDAVEFGQPLFRVKLG